MHGKEWVKANIMKYLVWHEQQPSQSLDKKYHNKKHFLLNLACLQKCINFYSYLKIKTEIHQF